MEIPIFPPSAKSSPRRRSYYFVAKPLNPSIEVQKTGKISVSCPTIHDPIQPVPSANLILQDKLLSANEGYTVAVKDNINTHRLPTTAASNILRTFQPHQNATVTRLLEKAGLVLLAKTNMDEFGMGSHSLNSAFGRMSNGGHRDALSVGGSSGGSAVVVSEYMAHYGIGTDTGGSVRLPAAYMALVGFKPSYGRISRYGVIPYANSLDTVGIIARSARDIHLMYGTFQTLSTTHSWSLAKPHRHS